MGLAFGLCAHALKLHAANPSGHGQDEERRMGERWGEKGGWEKGERGLRVTAEGGGHRLHLSTESPPPRPPPPPPSLPPSLLLPSLSPDNLCKVADETHSHSRRPDCQNKLAFLWKVIDRLKGYKLGACSSFLLRSWGLFAADSPRPKIKWTQAGMNGRALIE